MSKSYSDKLKDPRWQKRRLELLESAGFKCESCGDTEETLHVHHVYYEKDLNPWEYPSGAYLVLCSNCHERWHVLKTVMDRCLCKVDIDQLSHLQSIFTQLTMMGPNITMIFHDLITGYHQTQFDKIERSGRF